MNLNEIEMYFQVFGYPEKTIEIRQGDTLPPECAEMFVTNTILSLRAHSGNKGYMPYYDTLIKYYSKCRWQNNK